MPFSINKPKIKPVIREGKTQMNVSNTEKPDVTAKVRARVVTKQTGKYAFLQQIVTMTLVKGRINTNKMNRIGRKLEIKTKTTLTAAIIPIYEMF